MLGEAKHAIKTAKSLEKKGIYVVPFSYPVVPMGKARIRIQISALHQKNDLQKTVEAFKEQHQS